jgi:hypothetical protein
LLLARDSILAGRALAVRGVAPTIGGFLLVALLGCGSAGPKLSSVRGKVFHGDQPAEGATVVFQPKGDAKQNTTPPSGTVQADGSFTLRTYPHGEGAPPGEYIVLVTWYPPDARQKENPKNKLPAKYSDPVQTPFSATVKDGATELEPFQIPKK